MSIFGKGRAMTAAEAMELLNEPMFPNSDPFIAQFEREILRNLITARTSAAFPHPFRFPTSLLKDPIMSNASTKTFTHPTNGKTYKGTGTDISKVKVGDLIVGVLSKAFKEVLSVGTESVFCRSMSTGCEQLANLSNSCHYTVTELVTEKGYKRAYADGEVVPSGSHLLDDKEPNSYVMDGFLGWLEYTKVDDKVEDIKFIPYVEGQGF